MDGNGLLKHVDTYQKASLAFMLNNVAFASKAKVQFKQSWKDRMKQKLSNIKKSAISLFKRKPNRFAVLESRIANMENNVLDVENKMAYIRRIESNLMDGIDNEKRLRMDQAKRAKAAMEKHIEKVVGASYRKAEKFTEELVNYSSESVLASCKTLINESVKNNKSQATKCINDAINPAITKLNETHKKLETRINDIDLYLDKFEFIQNVHKEAEMDYRRYLQRLSEVDEHHFLPKRLASVETRITLLEGCHNGSGKTASGTA